MRTLLERMRTCTEPPRTSLTASPAKKGSVAGGGILVLWNYESEDYVTRFCSDPPPNLGGIEGLSQEDGESRLKDLH